MDNYIYKNLLTLNLSSEVLSSSQSSSAFSVNTMSTSGYQYGISFVKPVNPANSVELGFHLQKNMFEYGDVHFDVGIQDVLFRQGSDSTDADGLDTKGISLFAGLSSAKKFMIMLLPPILDLGLEK